MKIRSAFIPGLLVLLLTGFAGPGWSASRSDLAETAALTTLTLRQIQEFSDLLNRYKPEPPVGFTGSVEKAEAESIAALKRKGTASLNVLLNILAGMKSPEEIYEACLKKIADNDKESEKSLAALQELVKMHDAASSSKLREEMRNILRQRKENEIMMGVIVMISEKHVPRIIRNVQLKEAAMKGDTAAMEALHNEGADVRFRSRSGATALHAAAAKGQTPAIEWLIARGAEVNAGPLNTPLHLAVLTGNRKAVEILIASGADVKAGNRQTMDRMDMLKMALTFKDMKMMALRIGKEMAADQKKVSRASGGITPLHFAALGGHPEIARVLVANGADPNVADISGFTPLHLAAWGGSREAAAVLLEKGAKIDAAADRFLRYTPLMIAVCGGKEDAALFLLEKKADVNARSKLGMTALHFAIAGDGVKVAEKLLRLGADANARDDLNNTPLSIAEARKKPALIQLLKAKGSE